MHCKSPQISFKIIEWLVQCCTILVIARFYFSFYFCQIFSFFPFSLFIQKTMSRCWFAVFLCWLEIDVPVIPIKSYWNYYISWKLVSNLLQLNKLVGSSSMVMLKKKNLGLKRSWQKEENNWFRIRIWGKYYSDSINWITRLYADKCYNDK